jgi:predicted RNA-binding protein with PIN domain
MAEQTQWEYRVKTIGSMWTGTKDEQIEALLNEWGAEGWEAINVYTPENSNKVAIVAKRPLTEAARRRRSYPA